MELVLNLVGVLVAACLVSAWLLLWFESSSLRSGRLAIHLIALVLLIVIVFPVISVTDDLYQAQNPAETDSVQRRILAVSAIPIATADFSGLRIDELLPLPEQQVVWRSSMEIACASLPRAPILRSIENRPPPTA